MRQQLLDSIVKFYDKTNDNEIPITSRRIIFETSKYSSSQDSIWHVYINDLKLNKSKQYTVSYRCLQCENINTISTTCFLRKIRSEKLNCNVCKIHNMNNCRALIRSGDAERHVPNQIQPKCEPRFFHEQSISEFMTYPELYQSSYFLNHLSEDDYNRIRSRIKSIGNGVYQNIDRYEFWSIYKVSNQMRFTSIMYDPNTNSLFKANQPIMNCENCEKNWRAKSLEGFKNQYKILCNECKLCNRTFKIRPIQNCCGNRLVFQSKLEKKFIDWCNQHLYVVLNGPYIDYIHNKTAHKYRVDFQIGSLLIEVKDYHIWHKNQVESGKWQAKQDAVTNICKKEEKYRKFIFITPHNWNQMLIEIEIFLKNEVKI